MLEMQLMTRPQMFTETLTFQKTTTPWTTFKKILGLPLKEGEFEEYTCTGVSRPLAIVIRDCPYPLGKKVSQVRIGRYVIHGLVPVELVSARDTSCILDFFESVNEEDCNNDRDRA